MATKYVKCKTPGVRYREHPERKHGIRPDRYFFIRYKIDGKDREEALGWSSEGVTETLAGERLAEIKRNVREGQGPQSVAEKRAILKAEREAEEREKARQEKESITFAEVFEKHYYPQAETYKTKGALVAEEALYSKWIFPTIGKMEMRAVVPFHIDALKKRMADAGLSVRSFEYAQDVIRQAYNYAIGHELYAGIDPVTAWKKRDKGKGGKAAKTSNARIRFLSHEQADALLEKLAAHSLDVHDQALLSLHCGLRAGEVFALTWGDVDLARGVLTLKDTKSGKTRAAIMTEAVKAMFDRRDRAAPSSLVFTDRNGKRIAAISTTFDRVVKGMGLNAGVEDRRQRVVFHTLRHSFASWLVQEGVPLYTVAALMGHATLRMTERYSHLAPDHLQAAVRTLEASMSKAKPAKIVDLASVKPLLTHY